MTLKDLFSSTMYIYLLLFLLSCRNSHQNHSQDFDIPFLKEHEQILYFGNRDKYLLFHKKYLQLAKEMKYEEGKALCEIGLAHLKIYNGQYESSLSLLNHAQDILNNSSNSVHKAILYDQYSLLNTHLNLTSLAIDNNQKAKYQLQIAKNGTLKKIAMHKIYMNTATQQLPHDSTVIYFHKARAIEKNIITEAFLADYYIENNRLDSTIYYLNQAAQMTDKIKPVDVRHSIFDFVRARYYFRNSMPHRAEEAYLKALKMSLKTKSTIGFFRGIFMQIL